VVFVSWAISSSLTCHLCYRVEGSNVMQFLTDSYCLCAQLGARDSSHIPGTAHGNSCRLLQQLWCGAWHLQCPGLPACSMASAAACYVCYALITLLLQLLCHSWRILMPALSLCECAMHGIICCARAQSSAVAGSVAALQDVAQHAWRARSTLYVGSNFALCSQ
jgi:hypothetical protein